MAIRNPCDDIRRTRATTGLTQALFWDQFGTTQASGSRYEQGRRIPIPTQRLIEIAYGTSGDRIIKELRRHAAG